MAARHFSPYGYTTNLMVQNLGGYTRADYLRFVWLVSLTYSVVVLTYCRVFPFWSMQSFSQSSPPD